MQNVRSRFDDLLTETRQLNNQFVSDKKNADKYKKEFKYLNQEKLKFMSDLIKKLSLMGLSYRKGQIMNQKYTNIEQCILDDKTIATNYTRSHYDFYLCTRLYFNYKSTSASQQAANLPIEKFNGFLDHLFSLVHTQRLSLTKLSIDIDQLNCLKTKMTIVTQSQCLPEYNAKSAIIAYTKLKNVYRKLKKLLIQIKCFYENLLNLGQCENVQWIVNEYDEHIKHVLDQVLNLIPIERDSVDRLEFLYTGVLGDYVIVNREPIERLKSLIKKHCRPFYEYYAECVQDLEGVSIDANENTDDQTLGDDHQQDSIEHRVQQTKTKILKIVETFYKQYSDYVIKDLDSDHFFTHESFDQFTNDIQSFQLNTLIKQINKIISLSWTDSHSRMNIILEHVSQLKNVLDVFDRFVNAYAQYLSHSHLKCCQMFESLVKVFDEYKNGLSVPKELEHGDDQSGDNEPSADEKKFQTDDATGLGEGQGCKDVSDQIESEDQLDDAKTKQQREDEKDKNEDDSEQVEEEKNGIEMSEDFEAKMDDVDMQEQQDDDQEKDQEQEEELDDQKADVDNAMDYLDKQLWDQQDQDQSEQEENSFDEDINGGEKLDDKSEQLMAKEDNLNMVDNDEQKNQDDNNNNIDGDQLNDLDEEEEKEEKNRKENEINENVDEQKQDENFDDKNEQDEEKLIDSEGLIDEQKDNLSENENENEQDNNRQDELLNESLNEDNGEENNEKDIEKNEQDNKQNLIENNNKKNYQQIGDQVKDKNEKESNCVDNKDLNDDQLMDAEDDDEIKNEIEMNQEAENEMKNGQGQNELSVSSSERPEAQGARDQIKKNRLREKNENRVLQEEHDDEPLDSIKDLNIVDVNDDQIDEMNERENEVKGESLDYKHLNKEEEKFDERVYDAATDEQKKPRDRLEETRTQEEPIEDQLSEQLNREEEEEKEEKKNLPANKIDTKLNDKKKEKESSSTSQEKTSEAEDKLKQNFVSTVKIERPNESLFVTIEQNLSIDNINRDVVENDLAKYRERSVDHEAIDDESLKLWLEYEAITQQLSRELCEQLRLILEPTICSKLKGDYKTGKRLNMKRVVEYIATEYRKDKIWLRRTKPNKRDYQVVLAVDNSSSMSDNHCMQLAYETIATLTNAFTILEVGKFGLVSFGQQVELLHSLDDHFNSDVGARILSKINFKDDRTKIAEVFIFLSILKR